MKRFSEIQNHVLLLSPATGLYFHLVLVMLFQRSHDNFVHCVFFGCLLFSQSKYLTNHHLGFLGQFACFIFIFCLWDEFELGLIRKSIRFY